MILNMILIQHDEITYKIELTYWNGQGVVGTSYV